MRDVQFPISGGIGPVRLFSLKSKCVRAARRPSCGGTEPEKPLMERLRWVKRVRFERKGVMEPVRFLALRSKDTTLPPELHITPTQLPLQGKEELDELQELKMLSGSWEMLALKLSRASFSTFSEVEELCNFKMGTGSRAIRVWELGVLQGVDVRTGAWEEGA